MLSTGTKERTIEVLTGLVMHESVWVCVCVCVCHIKCIMYIIYYWLVYSTYTCKSLAAWRSLKPLKMCFTGNFWKIWLFEKRKHSLKWDIPQKLVFTVKSAKLNLKGPNINCVNSMHNLEFLVKRNYHILIISVQLTFWSCLLCPMVLLLLFFLTCSVLVIRPSGRELNEWNISICIPFCKYLL